MNKLATKGRVKIATQESKASGERGYRHGLQSDLSTARNTSRTFSGLGNIPTGPMVRNIQNARAAIAAEKAKGYRPDNDARMNRIYNEQANAINNIPVGPTTFPEALVDRGGALSAIGEAVGDAFYRPNASEVIYNPNQGRPIVQ